MQPSFFDEEDRLAKLEKLGDPLPRLDSIVDWRAFRLEKLFNRFDTQLWESGLMPKGGQIIDASLVNVPKNRNNRDETKQIKEGKTPEGWDDEPNMKRQKDEDSLLCGSDFCHLSVPQTPKKPVYPLRVGIHHRKSGCSCNIAVKIVSFKRLSDDILFYSG